MADDDSARVGRLHEAMDPGKIRFGAFVKLLDVDAVFDAPDTGRPRPPMPR